MPAGYFVRHKVTGFETYIPAKHWDESYKDEYHIRDPEAEIKAQMRAMREASERHDRALAEEAKKAADAKKPAPLKE